MVLMRVFLYCIYLLFAFCLTGWDTTAQPHTTPIQNLKKQKRFPGYTKQRKLFKQLCDGLKEDGYQTAIFILLTENPPNPEVCQSCSSFFRTFAANCRPAKPKSRDLKENPSPTPLPLIQPGALTATAARDLSLSMVQNDILSAPSFEALQSFLKLLDEKKRFSSTQDKYFEELASHLLYPFKVYQGYEMRRRKFRKMCLELREDGVDAAFHASLPTLKSFGNACMGCLPLIRLLREECKPDSAEDAFQIKSEAASEPSEATSESVLKIFEEIADDADLVDASVPAANLIAEHLRSPPLKYRAQASYLSKIAANISAPFAIYGKVKPATPALKLLCETLQRDSRREGLYALLTARLPLTKGCPACRALLKEFSDACRTPQHPPTPAHTLSQAPSLLPGQPKEREPHLQVISAATAAFSSLAANPDSRSACLPAIEFLVQVLRDPEGKSKGELEYFSTLAEYMQAPFMHVLKKKRQIHKSMQETGVTTDKGKNLDELFDF